MPEGKFIAFEGVIGSEALQAYNFTKEMLQNNQDLYFCNSVASSRRKHYQACMKDPKNHYRELASIRRKTFNKFDMHNQLRERLESGQTVVAYNYLLGQRNFLQYIGNHPAEINRKFRGIVQPGIFAYFQTSPDTVYENLVSSNTNEFYKNRYHVQRLVKGMEKQIAHCFDWQEVHTFPEEEPIQDKKRRLLELILTP